MTNNDDALTRDQARRLTGVVWMLAVLARGALSDRAPTQQTREFAESALAEAKRLADELGVGLDHGADE